MNKWLGNAVDSRPISLTEVLSRGRQLHYSKAWPHRHSIPSWYTSPFLLTIHVDYLPPSDAYTYHSVMTSL